MIVQKLLFRLGAEWKKVGGKFFLFLLVAVPVGVLAITCAFLWLRREQVADLPLALVVNNNLGAWSALLYPLSLIVVVQNLVDVETKNRQLVYLRAFKQNWYDLYFLKATVAVLAMALLTVSNIACNYVLIVLAQNFMVDPNAASLLLQSSLSFAVFIPALIPAVFFHLSLALAIRSGGITYLAGMLLLVVGIPVTNLTNLPIFPYSFGILALQPDASLVIVATASALFLLLCPVFSNHVLQR